MSTFVDQTPRPVRSGPRGVISRHPKVSFLVMTFALLWLSTALVLFLGWPPPPPTTISGHLIGAGLSMCSLALPAFLVVAARDGKAGVRDLLSRTLRWRVGIEWYAFAILAIPVGALLMSPLFLGSTPLLALSEEWSLVFTAFLPKVLLALVTVQLFEEIAWTGFMQHEVQARHGALRAALLTGPLFALIHLPTYMFGGPVTPQAALRALVMAVVFIPIAIFLRLLIAWTYNRTGLSVLLAALVHASWNSSAAILTPVTGRAAELLAIGTFVLLAIIVTALSKAKLGQERSGRPANTQAPSQTLNATAEA